jgi:hypothetical protein
MRTSLGGEKMSQRIKIRDVLFVAMKAEYDRFSGKIRARGRHSFRSGLMSEAWKFIGVWEYIGERPIFSGTLSLRQECLQGLLNIMDEPATLREEIKFCLLMDFAGFLGQEALAKQNASLDAMLAAKAARKASGDTRIPTIPGGGVVKAEQKPVVDVVPVLQPDVPTPETPDPTVTMTVEIPALEGGQGAVRQVHVQ